MRFAEIVLLGLPVALAAPAQTTPCTTSTTTSSTSSCTNEYKPTSKAHSYGYGYPVYNGTTTTTTSSATYSIKSYSASSSASSASLTTTSSLTSTGTSSSATDSTTSSVTSSETDTTTDISSTTTSTSSTTTTSSAAPTITGIDTLPECGQICLNAILADPNVPAIGCPTADPNCLCTKPNFFNAIRDCSREVCGAVGVDPQPVNDFGAALCAPVIATFTPTTTPISTPTNPPISIPTPAGIENLPECGRNCINDLFRNYADPNIGCSGPDPACLCTKPNFFFGIGDCSRGSCGSAGVDPNIAIDFTNAYCAPYTGGSGGNPNPNPEPVTPPIVPGLESQPQCAQTCFNNMLNNGNDPNVDCPTAEKSCFCGSTGFYNGLTACSGAVCEGNQQQVEGVVALFNEWCSSP